MSGYKKDYFIKISSKTMTSDQRLPWEIVFCAVLKPSIWFVIVQIRTLLGKFPREFRFSFIIEFIIEIFYLAILLLMLKLRSDYLSRYKQEYIWVEASGQQKESSSATPNYEHLASQLTFTGTNLTGSILIQNIGWMLGFEREKENQFNVTAPIADILYCALWSDKPFVNVIMDTEYFKFGKGGRANGSVLIRLEHKNFFKLSEDREETISSADDILVDHTPSTTELEMVWNGASTNEDSPPSMETVNPAVEKNQVLIDYNLVPLSKEKSTSLPTESVQKESTVEPRAFSSLPKPTFSTPTPNNFANIQLQTSLTEDMDISLIRDGSQPLFTTQNQYTANIPSQTQEIFTQMSNGTRNPDQNNPNQNSRDQNSRDQNNPDQNNPDQNSRDQNNPNQINQLNNPELNNSDESTIENPLPSARMECKMKVFPDRVEFSTPECKKIIPILEYEEAVSRGLLKNKLNSIEDRKAQWDKLLPAFNVLDMMNISDCEQDEIIRKRVRENDNLYLVRMESLYSKSQHTEIPMYYEEVCRTPSPKTFGYGLFDENDAVMPFTGKTN